MFSSVPFLYYFQIKFLLVIYEIIVDIIIKIIQQWNIYKVLWVSKIAFMRITIYIEIFLMPSTLNIRFIGWMNTVVDAHEPRIT